MRNALTNTAATTRLTIDPAIRSVLTDARLRRRSKKVRSNRSIGSRTMTRSKLCVRTNLALSTFRIRRTRTGKTGLSTVAVPKQASVGASAAASSSASQTLISGNRPRD